MAVKTKTSVLLRLAYGVAFGALAATSPALAADVAMPAYKAAAAPAAYDWSGFYLGVTAGGGMASLPVTSMDFFVGIGAMKSAGAVGGVHAGYNWQFTPSFLVGLEGDFNWASFKESDTTCFGSCALNLICRVIQARPIQHIARALRAHLGSHAGLCHGWPGLGTH